MAAIPFGPLEALLRDESITEIMVNSYRRIFVEQGGQLQLVPLHFQNEQELIKIIEGIASYCSREISQSKPYLDAHLPDGSRVNAVISPMAPGGANLTIRKFRKKPFLLDDLLQSGALDDKTAYFIHACVRARLNIVVSGGTGTGKTTFLNILSGFIPENERIITIEDVAELNLQHPNWVRLESVYGVGSNNRVTVRDCLINSLRMRPDRIIVGECRRDETFEMLQAMNTGHEGSMTTLHANTPRDCLARIESLVASGNIDFPIAALRKQMVSAIDIVIQLKRLRGGQRIVQEIIELTGIEQNTITTQVLFQRNFKNRQDAQITTSGMVPTFMERFAEHGIQFPPNYFDPATKITYRPD